MLISAKAVRLKSFLGAKDKCIETKETT